MPVTGLTVWQKTNIPPVFGVKYCNGDVYGVYYWIPLVASGHILSETEFPTGFPWLPRDTRCLRQRMSPVWRWFYCFICFWNLILFLLISLSTYQPINLFIPFSGGLSLSRVESGTHLNKKKQFVEVMSLFYYVFGIWYCFFLLTFQIWDYYGFV